MSKSAVTEVAALRVTTQVDVPVQAPDQPVNVDPEAAVAVSVTCVPLAKFEVQVPGQLIPEGLLVTVPEPEPDVATVRATGAAAWSKVAVTEVSEPSVTTQLSVPLHAPDQPVKVEVESGVAVSVSCIPPEKVALQVDPQLMPLGLLDTVPPPVPALCTESWKITFLWPLTEAQPTTRHTSTKRERLKTALNFTMNSPELPRVVGCGFCITGWAEALVSRFSRWNSCRSHCAQQRFCSERIRLEPSVPSALSRWSPPGRYAAACDRPRE